MLWENGTWKRKHTREIAEIRDHDPFHFNKIKKHLHCFGCWNQYLKSNGVPPKDSDIPQLTHYLSEINRNHYFRLYNKYQDHIPGCVFRDSTFIRDVAQRHGLEIPYHDVIRLPALGEGENISIQSISGETSSTSENRLYLKSVLLFQELYDGMGDDWTNQKVQVNGEVVELGKICFSYKFADKAVGSYAIITGVVQDIRSNKYNFVELIFYDERKFKITVSPGHLYDQDYLSQIRGRKIAIYGKVKRRGILPPEIELISIDKQLAFLDLNEKNFPQFDLLTIKDQRLFDTINNVLSQYNAKEISKESFPFRQQDEQINQHQKQLLLLEKKLNQLQQLEEDLQKQLKLLLRQQQQKRKYIQDKKIKEKNKNRLQEEIEQLRGWKRLIILGKRLFNLDQKNKELDKLQEEIRDLTNKIQDMNPEMDQLLDKKKDKIKTLKKALKSIQLKMKSVENSLEQLYQHNKIVPSWKEIADHADSSYLIQPHAHICLKIIRNNSNSNHIHIQIYIQPYEIKEQEKLITQTFSKHEIQLQPNLIKPYGKLFNQLKSLIKKEYRNV